MVAKNTTSTRKTLATYSITKPFQQIDSLSSRIFPNVIVFCLLTLSLWITISLIHYEIKTRKWRQLKRQSQADIFNNGQIYTSVVLCGVMVIFYDVVALIYMNTGFAINGYNLDDYCDSISDLAYSTYSLTIFTTTIFLWLRQRIFFQNRLLNANYNKCVKVLSSFSLFLILAAGIGILIFGSYPDDHIATTNGCVYDPNRNLMIVHRISMVTVVVVYQSLFLGLFVYAIKTIQTSRDNVGVCDESCRNDNQPLRRSESDRKFASKPFRKKFHVSENKLLNFRNRQSAGNATMIRSILIKTFAVAAITTMLDFLLVLFLSFVIKPNQHRRYSVMFASFNAFLHLFLIVLSFSHWKKMLMSFCWKL